MSRRSVFSRRALVCTHASLCHVQLATVAYSLCARVGGRMVTRKFIRYRWIAAAGRLELSLAASSKHATNSCQQFPAGNLSPTIAGWLTIPFNAHLWIRYIYCFFFFFFLQDRVLWSMCVCLSDVDVELSRQRFVGRPDVWFSTFCHFWQVIHPV